MGDTEWIGRYLAAWNTHDGSAVAAFMVADVTYEDLAQGAVHQGGKGWVPTFRRPTRGQATTASSLSPPNRTALPMIRGVSVGRLDGGGRITQNRDYFNFVDFLAQVGLLP